MARAGGFADYDRAAPLVDRAQRGILEPAVGLLRRARATRAHARWWTASACPARQWFPDARLNFAQNLLREPDDSDAIVFWGEDRVKRRYTRRQLHQLVSRLQQALAAAGVGKGDRVAGYLPNLPEATAAMLATTSLGAIWSSCSPDFGVRGVLDRFGQIEPKVLFCADGYLYGGKEYDSQDRVREILAGLPTARQCVVLDYLGAAGDRGQVAGRLHRAVLRQGGRVRAGRVQRSALHPVLVRHHRRTQVHRARRRRHAAAAPQGAPAALGRRAGRPRVLLHHARLDDVELAGLGPGAGATLLLYDGSPFVARGRILFDFADAEGMTHFGTSAKFIDAIAKVGLVPARTHKLGQLRAMLSTGSPLLPESFDYVYRNDQGRPCACRRSPAEPTSCPASCSATRRCRCGAARSSARAWAWRWRCSTTRAARWRGEKGELVCTRPFPAMPLGFWNDPDGARYRAAYFEKYPNVWRHGDWCEITPHGGMIIYGRSDAVLNPGGVRIGTAEIYRQVESLDEVVESIVIGQDWEGDVRVVLFVKLREGRGAG